MLDLIGLVAAGAITATGYYKTRDFVRRRLRFVSAVQRPAAPVVAGVGAAAVAAPMVALLPVVGVGTAVLFGVGVGAGVAAGVRHLRGGRHFLPE